MSEKNISRYCLFKGLVPVLTLFLECAVCLMVAHFTRGAALVTPRARVLARHQRPLAPGLGKTFLRTRDNILRRFS
jgi:hypothetical protein